MLTEPGGFRKQRPLVRLNHTHSFHAARLQLKHASGMDCSSGCVVARAVSAEGRMCRPLLRQVLQTALTPVINMLSVAGLVSIPGMLTGQILGGSEPVVAAKYQIMVMFAIAATSTAAVGSAVVLATLQLTDAHHCLRLDRLDASNNHAARVTWCDLRPCVIRGPAW